jgi:3-methyl-2-oxobutanoate hydroxymethyltransferase
VPAPVAARISETLVIPTIGIGSGAECDGQVLVLHDLLGLYEDRSPRFAKRYADIGGDIRSALERFGAEVRSGVFPAEEHTYAMPEEELEAFLNGSRAESRTET